MDITYTAITETTEYSFELFLGHLRLHLLCNYIVVIK